MKNEHRSNVLLGNSELGHLLLSQPIPKPLTKYGKEDVLEVVPHIEMLNHLGIGFCKVLWGGPVYLFGDTILQIVVKIILKYSKEP